MNIPYSFTLLILPLGVVGPWQVILIVLVILLLFGGRKIPELMRGLGKGVKEFKSGMAEAEKIINEEPEVQKSTGKALEPDKIEKTK